MSPRPAPATRLIPAGSQDLRVNNFNTIRIGMALAVVWSHCFALYLGTEGMEPVSRLLAGHCNAGEMAVRVFFVLSGFLVSQSYLNSSTARAYLSKRIKRVYPGFLTATAICTFVIVPNFSIDGWGAFTAKSVFDWLWHGLLLQELIPGSGAFADNPSQTVNGALWSIRYEFWFYICLAALGATGMLTRTRLMALIFLGSLAMKAWLDLTGRMPGAGSLSMLVGWPYIWFSMGPYFLAGCLAFLFGSRIPRRPSILVALLLALILAAQLTNNRVPFDLLAPLALAYSTFYSAFLSGRHGSDAARYGDMSYGAYLYGFPIQQMVKASLDLSFPVYVIVCLILSLAAGFLSWHLVEKRFLRPSATRPTTEPSVTATAARSLQSS